MAFLRLLTTLLLVAPCIIVSITPCVAQNAWREIRGGYREAINGLVVTSTGLIVHGTRDHGIVHSSDGGATWTRGRIGRQSIASSPMAVRAIVADERPGEIIAISGTSLFRSTDEGSSWTLHRTEIDDGPIGIAALIRLGHDVTLAGTSSSFWRSQNELTGYTRMIPFDRARTTTAFLRSGDDIVVGTDSGLYRFDANGALVGAGLRSGLHASAVISTLALRGTTLFAGTDAGLYRSDDLGGEWSTRQLDAERVRALLVLDARTIVAGTESGIHRSTDDGATWTMTAPALAGRWATELAMHPSGTLVAGTSLGIWLSDDQGASWRSAANGVESITTYQILGLDSATVLLRQYGGDVDVRRSTDAGLTWSATSGLPDTTVNELSRGAGGSVIAATARGLYRSSDRGASWSRVDGLDSSTRAAAIGPDGRLLAATVEGRGLLVSRDDGASWSRASMSRDFRALAFGPDGEMYALEQMGVHRSTDDGATWKRASVPGDWMGALAVDRLGHLFVGSDKGLFRSTDAGSTFARLDAAGPERLVDVVVASPDDHITIATSFVAGSPITRSDDGGATFSGVAHDFPVISVTSMSYDDAGYLYLVSRASGQHFITRTELPQSGAIRHPVDPPDGATGLPPAVTLQWNAVEGATAYHLQLSDEPTIGAARRSDVPSLHGAALRIDDSTLADPTRSSGDLTPGETYYWRVRARRNGAWDLWSPLFRFTTAGGPSAVDGANGGESIEAIGMRVRYRDGALSIDVDRLRAEDLRVDLFALDGALLSTLFDGAVDAGALRIEREGISPGAYLVVLSQGAIRQSRVVLVR